MLSALDILAIILCTAGLGVALALEIRSYSEKWGFRIFVVLTAIPSGATVAILFLWAAVNLTYSGATALAETLP